MYIESPYHGEHELPIFSLRAVDVPELVAWEVNGEYYLVMKVEMTGKRNRSDIKAKEDKAKLEGDFKVLSVRPVDHRPIDVKGLEQEDWNRTVADVKSGRA